VSQCGNYCFRKCRNSLGTISRTLQTDVLLIKLGPLILEQLFGNRQLVSDWDIIMQDTRENSTASKKNYTIWVQFVQTIIPSTRGSIKRTKNKIYFRYARFKPTKIEKGKQKKSPGRENDMPRNTFDSQLGCWLP
jgi:hypothetical protein